MLVDIPVPHSITRAALSPAAARLIQDASRRIDDFTRSHRPRIDNFVVCDFALADAAIDWICRERLLCGDSFCEWGSGFGVVTLLAAQHGLQAVGLEVEPSLVQQAEQLAEDHRLDARFVTGSFIPDHVVEQVPHAADLEHVETDSPSGYEMLSKEVSDFDLIFAFPWPGEEHFWFDLFDRFASDGALLLTYQGRDQLRLQRHSVTTGD